MSSEVASIGVTSGGQSIVHFMCPGCDSVHSINTNTWAWNGDLELPTFTPSVLVHGGSNNTVCHSFVTNGQIQFLGDCTHGLAGQTVPLPLWRNDE